jgi:hypothetical protein
MVTLSMRVIPTATWTEGCVRHATGFDNYKSESNAPSLYSRSISARKNLPRGAHGWRLDEEGAVKVSSTLDVKSRTIAVQLRAYSVTVYRIPAQ